VDVDLPTHVVNLPLLRGIPFSDGPKPYRVTLNTRSGTLVLSSPVAAVDHLIKVVNDPKPHPIHDVLDQSHESDINCLLYQNQSRVSSRHDGLEPYLGF
jgi:hypothetical protein